MMSLFHRGMGAKIEERFVKVVVWRGREVLKSQDKLKTTFMENPRTYYYTAKLTFGRKGGKGEKGLDNQTTSE